MIITPHVQRMILATVIAPIIFLPLIWIPTLSINLINGLTESSYHGHFRFFDPSLFISLYSVLVAFVVTLSYGLPVYLILNHFKKATLPHLALAGFLASILFNLAYIDSLSSFSLSNIGLFLLSSLPLSLLGTIVAIIFWLIAVPHSRRTNRNIKIYSTVIFSVTFILAATAWTLDEFFKEELRTASIENALQNNAPIPEWWNNVDAEGRFATILEARSLHPGRSDQGKNTSKVQSQNRKFFKLAYNTLQNIDLDTDTVLELVYLMDLPYVDYPHMFELQKYALTRQPYSLQIRIQLLMHMLTTSTASQDSHGYATSLSYDLITESAPRLSVQVLGPLCQTLASDYNGRAVSHFEIQVFKRCVSNLSKKPITPNIQQHLDFVEAKLILMNTNYQTY